MKRILVLLIAGIAILSGSCKKMLDETPYSVVSTGNFYKTASDAELAITGVYDVLNTPSVQGLGNQALWGRGMHYMTNLGVDDLTQDIRNTAGVPELLPFNNYTYTAENPLIWYSYFSLYAGINRANFIIEKVPSISMNTTRRAQIVGEAQYLRGMFYAYLGWLWGGVPLITGTVPDISSPRASLQQVLQQVEADLKAAYAVLPARATLAGRVNKYTAAGFLAKLFIYEASCKQNNVGQSPNFPLNSFDWVNVNDAYAQALNYCKDIYDNSGYRMIRPFNYLFLSSTEKAARDENMMIVQAGPNGNQEYILFSQLSGPRGNYRTNSGTNGFLRPVREAYTKLNANDGRINSYSGYLNTTTNFVIIENYKYYTPDPVLANLSNLCNNKWREDDPTAKTARGIAIYGGEADFAILRFADIVLTYAEARFQTGDEVGARALLREVRLRACGDDVTKVSAITTAYLKANFMDELLDERERELSAEGWRRFDLIRTGRIASVVNSLSTSIMFTGQDPVSIKQNFQPYKIWYPIPSRDLSTNTNLIQNPGY
ncbi:RagB/SusD family nutrient uptake outer membrane protein [Mucilaginibacter daejeonensis]|uniref:RagB/SusD family nutrient uptake outer membrane protein n=1 Tax=Mucilaginibacter daejeonensis TaxID=398049 RepID=UPI001D17A2FC|nr:RagB/SusD family nutrient uptake outer membrane protein [Mucilaginibacter daejeonensis]UEG51353.1 RagB/SusD family nutrient uptake outer membrane protein [Mucilaginibacter daejeonensis]